MGYSPQGHKESNTTEHACTHLYDDDENDKYQVQDTGHVF